jgi:hypothetical protein
MTRFAVAGLLVVVLIAAGCGATSSGANDSGAANSNVALERADNLLGKTQPAAGAAQTELTPKSFAALAKAHGYTAAVAAEVASRTRVEAAADRRTARRADAATRDEQRADRILVLVAAEQQAGGRVQNGGLALGLDEIATNEINYRKKLEQQAAVSERLARRFATASAAVRAWESQVRANAFPSRKAAKADYRRRVNRPLAIGLRLLISENLLHRRVAAARRSLRNSMLALGVVLRKESGVRREARQVIQADPHGFLASRSEQAG